MHSIIGARAALVTLVLGAAGSAVAAPDAQVRHFEEHPHPTLQRKTSTFEIDAERGRAWVEVTLSPHSPEHLAEVVRVKVPGLSYDASSRKIVYRANERVVECATVERRGRGPFARDAVQPTGRCELTPHYVRVPVDDGFTVAEVTRLEVHVKTPS